MNNQLSDLKYFLSNNFKSVKPIKESNGIHSWFPFYAGYSHDFVENTIKHLKISKNSCVFDPWNGSGTTTTISSKMGYRTIGLDINPATALIASARLANHSDIIHAAGLAEEIVKKSNNIVYELASNDALLQWFSTELTVKFRKLLNTIIELLASKNGTKIQLSSEVAPPFASFFILSLIRAGKDLINVKKCSNPTWIAPEKISNSSPDELDKLFIVYVNQQITDLSKENLKNTFATYSSISIGDSRAIKLKSNSCDLVITSPPYCTRLDYFKATEFELACLNISRINKDKFKSLRQQAMGTTLIRKNSSLEIHDFFPNDIKFLLTQIKEHPSYASSSYYFKQYNQYFHDLYLSMKEIQRVLKSQNFALLVVQASYYKDIKVDLGEHLISIAKQLNMKADFGVRTPVKHSLSTINTKSKKYTSKKEYFEDIIIMEKV